MSNREKLQEFNETYQDSYNGMNQFYSLAEKDLKFYLGDQWDAAEKKKLLDEGRHAFCFNFIRKNIDLLVGYQIAHRLSSVVAPVEHTDQKGADQRSKLLLYILQYGEAYKEITNSFAGGLKTGFNLLSLWTDYRDDPIDGDIRFGRDPFSGFICDPYFTQLDFSDCSHIIRRKYLSEQQAASLLPNMKKDIKSLAKIGWDKDDKFTWLPYQRQPSGKNFLAYNEFYQQKWKDVPMIVDRETGEYDEWEGDNEALRFFMNKFPQLEKVNRPKRYIERQIIVNNEYMTSDINPNGLDEYPFVPFMGIFEPEAESWALKAQSLTRFMIDPQRESNQRRSQLSDMVNSQINTGYLAKKSAIVNPKSLFQSSQGKVVWLTDNAQPGDVEKIIPSQIPQSMFELMKQFDQDIMTVCGINDASFGMTENAQESGIMMMLRQSSSVVSLQHIFDNLRFAQKCLSHKILKVAQQWTPAKIERILGEKPSEQFYSKDCLKYDITVKEGLLTDTQRQVYFRQLVDLKQLTDGQSNSPITAQMLVDNAPIQGKSDLDEQVAQNQQQAQQAQQQAQQIQQATMENLKADSINKIAQGKEHFTRGVANLGLNDEREAEAIQNRAQAVLDRAKAMKELESMDDDKLMKYLGMVVEFEKINQQKSEQMKGEDIAITAQAEDMNMASQNEGQNEGNENQL